MALECIRRTFRRAPWAIGLTVIATLMAVAWSAWANDDDEDDTPPPPHHWRERVQWRLGAGLGGSWIPTKDGSISVVVARASVGFDYGRYSLRALPSLQYGTLADHQAVLKIFIGYLALENVVRVTPAYSLSVAPLVGYAYSPDPSPGCTDSCTEPIGNGLTLGADVSPATFVFGRDSPFELGLHADIFVFKANGYIWPGAYLDLRWMFETFGRAPPVSGARGSPD